MDGRGMSQKSGLEAETKQVFIPAEECRLSWIQGVGAGH